MFGLDSLLLLGSNLPLIPKVSCVCVSKVNIHPSTLLPLWEREETNEEGMEGETHRLQEKLL